MTVTSIFKATKKVQSVEDDAQVMSSNEDWLAAVHLGVFNTMATIADKHADEIDAEEQAERNKRIAKAKRAVLKAYLVNKHLKGQHDQEEHGNWADDHIKPRMKTTVDSKGREKQEYNASGDFSDITYALARLLKLPERIADKAAHNSQHMAEWFKEKNWGQKILTGAGFLGRTNPQVGTAAAAATVLQGLKDNPEARAAAKKYYLRYGGLEYASPGIKRGKGANGQDLGFEKDEHFRNRVYETLANGIPGDSVARLSKATGSFPPSEGIIIGGRGLKRKDGTTLHGEAVVRALGKGGDNYMPFSAKHMAKARDGGWLLRRRTWGGPTAEDLHISMAFGAKGAGVVSRHGIYEIQWNDQYLGGKGRLGIEHKRILDRYNELLSMVGTGQVKVDTFDGSGNKSGQKRVSLNHDGYSLVLDALQAEFPWYIETVRHEKADNKKRNADQGSGFRIWGDDKIGSADEVDVSAKVRRKKDDGWSDYTDAFSAATLGGFSGGGGGGGNGNNGGTPQPRPLSFQDRINAEARRRGVAPEVIRREITQREAGGGQQQRGYEPQQRRSVLDEETDPVSLAAQVLQSAKFRDVAAQATPAELNAMTNMILGDDGVISAAGATALRDVLDRGTRDRRDSERNWEEPDADDLLRIEAEEYDQAQREAARRAAERDRD